MKLQTERFLIRDFYPGDQASFLEYQRDARYRALYRIAQEDDSHASSLFALFLQWGNDAPRTKFQLGVFDKRGGQLLGCTGLRFDYEDPTTAEFGLEIAPPYWGLYRLAIEVVECMVEWAFNEAGANCIVCRTSRHNVRAKKLLEYHGALRTTLEAGSCCDTGDEWLEMGWQLSIEMWRRRRARRNPTQTTLTRHELELPVEIPPAGPAARVT